MKKYLKDFKVTAVTQYQGGTAKIVLHPNDGVLPNMLPGQFVNIDVHDCKDAFLRRPISICDVNEEEKLLYLYIKRAGKGTDVLCNAEVGDIWNILLPLGNGFKLPGVSQSYLASCTSFSSPLLIGGGVGVAPLFYLGRKLKTMGIEPTFLLGGASVQDLPLLSDFRKIGRTFVTTVDGSEGTKGFVTDHQILINGSFDKLYCCGPTPMMKAIAHKASEWQCDCEVSLENRMACGLGACLCCVEGTKTGNRCVCTEGTRYLILTS